MHGEAFAQFRRTTARWASVAFLAASALAAAAPDASATYPGRTGRVADVNLEATGFAVWVRNSDGTHLQLAGNGRAFAWYPGGRYLALVDGGSLVRYDADTGAKVKIAKLPDFADIRQIAIAPDARTAYLVSKQVRQCFETYRYALGTGAAAIVHGDDATPYITDLTFAGDGSHVAFLATPQPDDCDFARAAFVGKSDAALTARDRLFTPTEPPTPGSFSWTISTSPDGRRLAYIDVSNQTLEIRDWDGDLIGGPFPSRAAAQYLPDGRLISLTRDNKWNITDPTSGALLPTPSWIANAPRFDSAFEPVGPRAEFTTDTYLNSTQVDFKAEDAGPGATYAWDFGDGQTSDSREVSRLYDEAGEYDVRLTVTLAGNTDARTHTVAADPARTYAPTVVLHPAETRYPYDPAKFITKSALKWSHDRGCRDDTIDRTVSAGKLGSGGYKHRRAGDATCAHTGKRYSTKQLTAPRDERSVLPPGEKLEGFYLDLDKSAYGGTKSMSKVPMYVEFESDRYVVYWLFYAFNDWKGTTATLGVDERHEGDWEHVVVRLSDTNNARQVAYYEHYCQPTLKSWEQMRAGYGSGTGLDDDTHPMVFAAKGGHASYWKPGTFKNNNGQTSCGAGGKKEMVEDHTGSSRKRWKPWSGAGIRNARAAGWYGYGGLWGKPGRAKKLYSSGILGPSTYKFNDPKVGVVPASWQQSQAVVGTSPAP